MMFSRVSEIHHGPFGLAHGIYSLCRVLNLYRVPVLMTHGKPCLCRVPDIWPTANHSLSSIHGAREVPWRPFPPVLISSGSFPQPANLLEQAAPTLTLTLPIGHPLPHILAGGVAMASPPPPRNHLNPVQHSSSGHLSFPRGFPRGLREILTCRRFNPFQSCSIPF